MAMTKKQAHIRIGSVLSLLLVANGLLITVFPVGGNPATIYLERSEEWGTDTETWVRDLHVEDVDADGVNEIVTGGGVLRDGRWVSQLRIWSWDGTILTLERNEEWQHSGNAQVRSVCVGDVDNDGVNEIVTGGLDYYSRAQVRVWSWDGTTLALEKSEEWIEGGESWVTTVFISDIDNDGTMEIVTGGMTNSRFEAQLRIWDGTTLALEKSEEWTEGDITFVESIYADDVDNDNTIEIITGGSFRSGGDWRAQLTIWGWDGTTLTLENSQKWGSPTLTEVDSVSAGDVDGDGLIEIVSVGAGYDSTGGSSQLRIWSWDGASMTLEKSQDWYATGFACANSVNISDIDGDGDLEIVTGGYANDHGQLRIWSWDGLALTLEDDQEWLTAGITSVYSVQASNVDRDYEIEIVTGGYAGDKAQLRIWHVPVTLLSANIDIDPDTLNLKSNGEWITCYVELPNGFDLSSIEVGSIVLIVEERRFFVDPGSPMAIGDYDRNGILDLMVKFDRAAIVEHLSLVDCDYNAGNSKELEFAVSGSLAQGIPFEGSDTVQVLLKK